ncbi:hypothetical protein [Roseofilum sp. Guam]|nr:hypothetical protein [Roseofilum sp. Guam]MBP0029800.1 hypothetical protein [Roseofilum sp. Guam]
MKLRQSPRQCLFLVCECLLINLAGLYLGTPIGFSLSAIALIWHLFLD